MREVGAREGTGSWRSEQEGGSAVCSTAGDRRGVATMGSFVFLIVVVIHDIKSVILTNFSVQYSELNCIHFVVQLSPGCRWCLGGRRQGEPPPRNSQISTSLIGAQPFAKATALRNLSLLTIYAPFSFESLQ